MLHEILLRAENLAEAVARVVGPKLHRDGPVHHGADALAHAPGGLGPDVPDAPERLAHVGALYVAHGHRADVREHVPREARHPILGMLGVTPAGMLVVPDPLGGGGEGGYAVGADFLGERVAAGACELAVGEGLVARLLERHEREAAESDSCVVGPNGRRLALRETMATLASDRDAVYSRMVVRRASTSSMMCAGTVSRRFPFRAPRSRARGWSQRITPLVRVPAPSRDTVKPRRRAKLPPRGDGQDDRRPGQRVERGGGHDQYRPGPLLFMAGRGIKADKPDVAPLHYNSSLPTGLASIQSRSSAERVAVSSHCASSSSSE